MKINGKTINIENLVEEIDIDKNIPLKRKNGLILRNSHIEILRRNNIDYTTHSSLESLIFEIEEIINDGNIDEELEWLSEELTEINYYNYTNK